MVMKEWKNTHPRKKKEPDLQHPEKKASASLNPQTTNKGSSPTKILAGKNSHVPEQKEQHVQTPNNTVPK